MKRRRHRNTIGMADVTWLRPMTNPRRRRWPPPDAKSSEERRRWSRTPELAHLYMKPFPPSRMKTLKFWFSFNNQLFLFSCCCCCCCLGYSERRKRREKRHNYFDLGIGGFDEINKAFVAVSSRWALTGYREGREIRSDDDDVVWNGEMGFHERTLVDEEEFHAHTVNVQNADVVVTVFFRLALVLTETDHFVGSWPARFFQ